MTTVEANYPTSINETEQSQMYEIVKERFLSVSRFIIDRFTLNGDHQTGKSTDVPTFPEEHRFIPLNIVLGEE
jgi:hypothetical protein